MKKTLRHWAVATTAAVVAIAFSSCAYDPYYSSSSVGGSYSSGYGDGYGYGGGNFSTSVFVSTGNPRWGYDPHCYSYYDYSRRAYYDPYLNGYYPVGYRPVPVYGCPHPGGWRPGRGYCPPPGSVRNVTVVNYRNREASYRNSNYSWSKQVRGRDNYNNPGYDRRPSNVNPTRQYYNPGRGLYGGEAYKQSGPRIEGKRPSYSDPRSGYKEAVRGDNRSKYKSSEKYSTPDKRAKYVNKPTNQKARPSRQEYSRPKEKESYKQEGKRIRGLGEG